MKADHNACCQYAPQNKERRMENMCYTDVNNWCWHSQSLMSDKSNTVYSRRDEEFENLWRPASDDNVHVSPHLPRCSSSSLQQRRGGHPQLWQFLVSLLDDPRASCIVWTGRGAEFKLIEPEEVARRWGVQKNRPAMNYDKLSRSLRYYYEKGIVQKVAGERYVYRFVSDLDSLLAREFSFNSTNQNHLRQEPAVSFPHTEYHQLNCLQDLPPASTDNY